MRLRKFMSPDGDEGQGGGAGASAETVEQVQTPDFNQVLETTTGGRFKTQEEAKTFFESFDEHYIPSATLADKYIPKDQAYANGFVRELNDMIKSGSKPEDIQLFYDLSNTDFATASPRDLLIKKSALEDGLSIREAALLVDAEFPTLENYLSNKGIDTDDEIAVNRAKQEHEILEVKLKKQAKDAMLFLEGKKKNLYENIDNSANTQAQANERIEAAKKIWTGNNELRTAISSSMNHIPIVVKDENQKIDYSIQIPIPETVMTGLYQKAENFAIQYGAEPSKENITEIVKILKADYISNNFESIISSVIIDNTNKIRKATIDELSNPEKDKNNNGTGGGNGAEDASKSFYAPRQKQY